MESLAVGDFVALRGRHWLVQGLEQRHGQHRVALACIEDDAQGERLDVVWEAEIAPRRLDEDPWAALGANGTDDRAVFGAFLRTLRWNTATAADRKLLQAPFRAGIRLDPFQLLPLRKALDLPRVNLLIADDVGLGKTIEAGLVLRELLLRRRIDFALVAAPASVTLQWEDELRAKFGLAFRVVDRELVAAMRRQHGFGVNVWRTGAAFIVSHNLLIDETYAADLRSLLSPFRPRSLLILDEAHHAAPSSGARYATDSQFTRAVRTLAPLFEHRLFLSATPHNGHSNSFSTLLELLDPQRFTAGVPVDPKELEPVMVRRLKSDLRTLGARFPDRNVVEMPIEGLPDDAPELALARMLADYEALREQRLEGLPGGAQARARLVFSGLQQRLLSSIPAFCRTLEAHRKALARQQAAAEGTADAAAPAVLEAVARPFALRGVDSPTGPDPEEEDAAPAEAADDADTEAEVQAATALGSAQAPRPALAAELDHVDRMLALAQKHRWSADARVRWLQESIRSDLAPGGVWGPRRLIVFTEWVDTLNWLRTCLAETIARTDRADERIAVITGTTDLRDREAIKEAFNTDPDETPVRILLATDAAREGINLQAWCADLLHFDLPWNPARLEQRNGRIDRKLQPAETVTCRYFRYTQRPEDIVLRALVRKTEKIRKQLGSLGQVIGERLQTRLGGQGIARGQAERMAADIEADDGGERVAVARQEMDDGAEARRARLARERDQLARVLEQSRRAVGIAADDLRDVVGVALERLGVSLPQAAAGAIGTAETFRLDPAAPGFASNSSWSGVFDELRKGRPERNERLAQWRNRSPVRSIAFAPPVRDDDRDDPDTVQLHVEHRLVRRLLSRFVSQGFQTDLARVTVLRGSEARARVVLLGRLCLYGSEAQRLHERILSVSAWWAEPGPTRRNLAPFGADGEAATLERLERALRDGGGVDPATVARVTAGLRDDVADLLPELTARADAERAAAQGLLAENGVREAAALRALLMAQRDKIVGEDARFNPVQLELDFANAEERRQRLADRQRWQAKLGRIEADLRSEPDRVRRSYDIAAHRLEPVGVVYLVAPA